MAIKIENAGPKVGKRRVQQFERDTGITLPADYRDFLLRHNGGHPVDSRFEVPAVRQDALLDFLYGLDRPSAVNLEHQLAEWKSEMPAGFLVIADDPGGAFVVMSTAGERAGHVFLWDHQHRFLQSSHEENTYPLAESFSAFIASLKPDDGPSRWDADVPEAAELIRQTLAHARGILPIQMARLASEFAKAPQPRKVVAQVLRELFDHESLHVRRVAVQACRRIGDFQAPGLREALVKKLADPNGWVRYDAAWAIREAGYDGADVRKALTKLAGGSTLAELEAELQKQPSSAELHARREARKALDALGVK